MLGGESRSGGTASVSTRVAQRIATSADAVDGVVPARVARPQSATEVASIVQECRSSALALLAVGGGTLIGVGNVPQRYDVKVDLSALPPTVEPFPDDMVITVASGVTLAELDRRLSEVGQRVALDAPDARHSTVGGLAAADFAGPLSYRFGNPRDNVLGMTVVDGRGRVLRVGGRVVKNVAGYDMPRLFVGSYGTLGLSTSLTLRTHPRPACARRLSFHFDSAAQLETARAALFVSSLPLSGLDLTIHHRGDARRWALQLLVEGTASEVDCQHERIVALCGLQEAVAPEGNDEATAARRGPLVVRFATRPANGVALAVDVADAASAIGISGSIDGEAGALRLRWHANTADVEQALAAIVLCRKVAARHAAATLVESAPTSAKQRTDVWSALPIGFDIMKRLKERFDPDGVLAPGRFVGGI